MMKMSIGALWVRFVSIIALLGLIAGLYYQGAPLEIVLGLASLLLVIFIVIALALNIGPSLSSIGTIMREMLARIEAVLREIREILASGSGRRGLSPSPSPERREEEVMATGDGALVGLALGGLVGLVGGPIGVITGGLIGALIGNEVERQGIKAERRKVAKR